MSKRYKLKLWYPSLPEKWKIGDIFNFSKDCLCYFKEGDVRVQFATQPEVENNPTFWEEIKEPLLVTEDEYKVYNETDRLYAIVLGVFSVFRTSYLVSKSYLNDPKSIKYFYSEDAANKYVDQNKPIFSKRQLKEAVGAVTFYFSTEKFIEVNSFLKQLGYDKV